MSIGKNVKIVKDLKKKKIVNEEMNQWIGKLMNEWMNK